MKRNRARRSLQLSAELGDLRSKILAASVALIEDEGLARLSMREVARRAGVSHQAPYHYFANREAILGEIAEQGFNVLNESIESAVDDRHVSNSRAVERVVAMGRAYFEFARKYPAHFRVMFRPELVDLNNCPGARAEGIKVFQTLKRVVHEAVCGGLPAKPSESALLTLIWSVGHGLSCLLLEGSLVENQPDTRLETHIDEVINACGLLLDASVEQKKDSAPRVRVNDPVVRYSGSKRKTRTGRR